MVYVLKAGPFFKIGWSKSFKKRLSEIKSCCPHKVQVIIEMPKAEKYDEIILHRKFRHKKAGPCREWFSLSESDLDLLGQHKVITEERARLNGLSDRQLVDALEKNFPRVNFG